jgi:hypothetical protein
MATGTSGGKYQTKGVDVLLYLSKFSLKGGKSDARSAGE